MPDLETTQPRQLEAALRPDTDLPEADPEANDERSDEPARRVRPSQTREGLPSSYRMRHASHYVEQLMGGGPIQTVRHVAIDQVHNSDPGEAGSDGDRHDIAELTASIRRVGVLQPILVVQAPGPKFHLIAGEKRWRAARAAGLSTVPCLVVHADAARAADLRVQAAVTARRSGDDGCDPVGVKPESVGASGIGEDAYRTADVLEVPVGGVSELQLEVVGGGHTTQTPASVDASRVSETLAPETTVSELATRSDLHQSVLADLSAIEQRQASNVAAANAFLSDERGLESVRIDWTLVTHALRRDAGIEARLRGVWLEWSDASNLRTAKADGSALLVAWSSMLHAAFASASSGDRLTVSLATPRIRPAIIFSVALEAASIRESSEKGAKPMAFGGVHGDVLLASARHSARRQGGRLSVTSHRQGVTLEFVVPQALAYWQ